MRTAIHSSSEMNKNCISFGALSKFKKQIGFFIRCDLCNAMSVGIVHSYVCRKNYGMNVCYCGWYLMKIHRCWNLINACRWQKKISGKNTIKSENPIFINWSKKEREKDNSLPLVRFLMLHWICNVNAGCDGVGWVSEEEKNV